MSLRRFLRLFVHVQMLPILESGEETLVGGQAVMEGVMMRAPHSYCVAVRKPSGEIVSEEMPVARLSEKYPWLKYPMMRGLGTLGQAMSLGVRALKFSANAALDDGAPEKNKPTEVTNWMMAVQVIFSVVFFLVVYKLIPLKLTDILSHWQPAIKGQIAYNAVDGVIRLAIFIGFMLAISRAKDIRRVFEFHGAEHKVVFNFESGRPVTVENAQQFVTWHPRCGTSFMFVIMLLSTRRIHADSRADVHGKGDRADRNASGDYRIKLRTHPFRGETAGLIPGFTDRARTLDPAHHHQTSLRRTDGRGD